MVWIVSRAPGATPCRSGKHTEAAGHGVLTLHVKPQGSVVIGTWRASRGVTRVAAVTSGRLHGGHTPFHPGFGRRLPTLP